MRQTIHTCFAVWIDKWLKCFHFVLTEHNRVFIDTLSIDVRVFCYLHFIDFSSSGLDHSAVQRMKATWERVPNKYTKIFEVSP